MNLHSNIFYRSDWSENLIKFGNISGRPLFPDACLEVVWDWTLVSIEYLAKDSNLILLAVGATKGF